MTAGRSSDKQESSYMSLGHQEKQAFHFVSNKKAQNQSSMDNY